MDAFPLFNERGECVDIWACGKCRKLTLGNELKNTRESAEACCLPPVCEICDKPMVDVKNHRRTHDSCQQAERRRREVERLEKAEIVEDYDGWLYSDDLTGHNEGYFRNMQDLLDYLDWGEDEERPEFVFCCASDSHALDIGRIIENATCDGYEDMAEMLHGEKELGAAIDAFNELNKVELTSWHPDYKRKVKVLVGSVSVEGKEIAQ